MLELTSPSPKLAITFRFVHGIHSDLPLCVLGPHDSTARSPQEFYGKFWDGSDCHGCGI
jgi:hypothetical protein